jgi:subtilisin-like proprotein convertase family protein
MHITVKECENVEQLEHVVANISFKYSIRGDLKLTLISPSGTPSEILSYRKHDFSNKGAKFFPFMTVFNWGESPIGKWTLIIESKSRNEEQPNSGRIEYFSLKLFGTTIISNKNSDSNFKSTDDKVVSRYLDRSDSAFIPTFSELKNIYTEEKKLSRQTRIIERKLLESNPELRNILSNEDDN